MPRIQKWSSGPHHWSSLKPQNPSVNHQDFIGSSSNCAIWDSTAHGLEPANHGQMFHGDALKPQPQLQGAIRSSKCFRPTKAPPWGKEPSLSCGHSIARASRDCRAALFRGTNEVNLGEGAECSGRQQGQARLFLRHRQKPTSWPSVTLKKTVISCRCRSALVTLCSSTCSGSTCTLASSRLQTTGLFTQGSRLGFHCFVEACP